MPKISISLPDPLLQTAEDECRLPGETRSELFRRALESLLRDTRERGRVATYLAGYIAEPESEAEATAAAEASGAALAQDPWD